RYRRIEGGVGGDGGDRRDRHVLHIEGHHIYGCSQFLQRGCIVELATDQLANLRARRIATGVQEGETQAQGIARQGQHASQLARPDDADVHAGMEGSGCARTLAVCCARQSSRALRTSGYLPARMAAASSAALTAPAVPMAMVPTGTPAGICTMDSRESMPLSMRDCTGTPSTGRVV